MPSVWINGKKVRASLGKKWEDPKTGWQLCYQYKSGKRRLLQYRGITNEYTSRGKWHFNPNSKVWKSSTRKWR